MKQNPEINEEKKEQSFDDPVKSENLLTKLTVICGIVIMGFTLSVIFHYSLINYFELTGYIGWYPHNTFLYYPPDKFNDFFNIYKASIHLDPYSSILANYFPFIFIIMYIFTFLPPGFSFFIFTLSFVFFFSFYLYKNLQIVPKWKRIPVLFVLSFMTYPFLFNLDRGNLEAWLFLSLVLFIYFYGRNKYLLSMIFLSFAIAFKLYPAVLMLLFVVDKKYKYAIYTCVFTLLISLLSALIFKGGLVASVKGLMASLSAVGVGALGYQGLQHNTSIFAPLKLLYDYILLNNSAFTVENDKLFYNAYFLFALILFALVLFFLFRYELAFWKKVALLVMSFITLPQIAYDYKLINLFIPLILFIRSDEESEYNIFYAMLFGLILIPKDYYYFIADVSISSVINPILISSLIMLILFETARSGKKRIYMNHIS